MSGRAAKEKIQRPRDVLKPLPCNPRPHDLGKNLDLDQCRPFVFDGAAEHVQLGIQVTSDEVIEFSTVAALFDVTRTLHGCGDVAATLGVRQFSSKNSDSLQLEASVELIFAHIPVHIVHVVVAVVASPKTFAFAHTVDFCLRQLSADDDGNRVVSKLGTRRCRSPDGQAFCVNVFVRKGAWWHMFSCMDPIPGCTAADQVVSLWQAGALKTFLKQELLVASLPARKRVVFRVLQASNLAAHDVKLFARNSSDPYLVVTCGEDKQDYQVQFNTLNPKWELNQGAPTTLKNVLASDARDIRVMMYDRDKFKRDDFMGCCLVPVAGLWNLSDGTHVFNFLLMALPADELDRLKAKDRHEYKRHVIDNRKVQGHITVEATVSDEPLPRDLELLLQQRTRTAELLPPGPAHHVATP